MGLPLSFLLGLLLLVAHDALEWSLPGSGSWTVATLLAPVTVVPAWFAHRTYRRLLLALRAGRDVGRWQLLPATSLPFVVALAFGALVFFAHLPDLIAQWAGSSHFLGLLGLGAPLLAMEASVQAVQRAQARWLGQAGAVRLPPSGPDQLALTWFLLVPMALVALVLDLLVGIRDLEVFFLSTSLGRLLGSLGLLVLLGMLLPLAFRWILPLQMTLPARHEPEVQATVAALGFPRRNVLALDTGHRIANAALVGPLPWPRYLILTDGILSLLEPWTLRSVVAHEIGHARAGHPGWLLLAFVLVPLLLLQPVLALDPGDTHLLWLLGGGVVALAAAISAFRVLGHRYEHEADLLAAQAVGGSAACIAALVQVGGLAPGAVHERSLRHPTTQRRVELLLRAEQDAGFVGRFWRRGRALRAAIIGAAASAALVCVVHEHSAWPLDRVVWSLETGRFGAAADRFAELSPVDSAPEIALRQRLAREIALARELAPDGGDWPGLARRFGREGVQRGLDRLRAGDTTTAAAWFSLALADPDVTPLVQSLQMYAVALDDGDGARIARLRAHIASLQPPAEVAALLDR